MHARDYDAIAAAVGTPSLRLLSLDEFLTPPQSPMHLIENLIPAEALVMVFGPAKSGKTFSVCDLVMHAAHGMHWHGHTVSKAMRVVFLAGEGRNGLKIRLKAWIEHHATELKGDFSVLPESLSLPKCRADLLECLRPIAPDLVVVDTLNAYFGGGDENSTQDMTTFVAAIRSLRDEVRCSVVIIHHTGHAEVMRERGSSVLRAAADVIVHVARDESGSGLTAFQIIEARDMEPWEAPLSLRLRRVETEWTGAGGQSLSTCIVEAGGQPVSLPGRNSRPLGDAQSALLEAARELARGREPMASGEILLARAAVSKLARERGIAKQSVSSAWASLANRGALRLIEPGSVAVRIDR